MRRALGIGILIVGGLYLLLHLVLGSSPFQRKVVAELRKVLSDYGVELQIESIEFSPLAPRIYLNRVTLKILPTSPLPPLAPVEIDKIKVEFQPVALLSKQISIKELTLFHPRMRIPHVDVLYKRVNQLIKTFERKEQKKQATFSLIVRKVGVVDALYEVSLKEPALEMRSRSFSASVDLSSRGATGIFVDSTHFEIERNRKSVTLTRMALDSELRASDIEMRDCAIESEGLNIQLKGLSSLTLKKNGLPVSMSGEYDVRIPVAVLNVFDLGLPILAGEVSSKGTIRKQGEKIEGDGKVQYKDLNVDGYRIGAGAFHFQGNRTNIKISEVDLRYAGGQLSSSNLSVELKDSFPVSGKVALKGVLLEGILTSLKTDEAPIHMKIDGTLDVKGTLTAPFELRSDAKLEFADFRVYEAGAKQKPTIVELKRGKIDALLTFTGERMAYRGKLAALGGQTDLEGYVGYDNEALVKTKSEGLSLTELRHIADLSLGGKANIAAQVQIRGNSADIAGNIDVQKGELSDLKLGDVSGQVHYANGLLSFDNLHSPTSLEPLQAKGYVDFRPEKTHYRFDVEARRVEVARAFQTFDKVKLSFPIPTEGEANVKVSIEGGHDPHGIEVRATGGAKSFVWYDEHWYSSTFNFVYRTDEMQLPKLLLFKKSGGIEIIGDFRNEKPSKLRFISHGLHLEELEHVGKVPLRGELLGEVELSGDLGNPLADGSLKLVRTSFRGEALEDSIVRFHSDGDRTEILGRVVGEKLKGRMMREGAPQKTEWAFQFQNFDLTPLLSMWLKKDISIFSFLRGTGEVTLQGDLRRWHEVRGKGSLRQLSLGVRGTTVALKAPVEIMLQNGTFKLPRFSLVGKDTEINGDLITQFDQSIQMDLDARLDFQLLQPFIPGLEYGGGRFSTAMRISGHPKAFSLVGNISLEDGSFRIAGFYDEFRNARVLLSMSQDRINVDRFTATLNGGTVGVTGDVRIQRFKEFVPSLALKVDRILLRYRDYLTTLLSGRFAIQGTEAPYLLAGKCLLHEANLVSFDMKETAKAPVDPSIRFDIACDANDKLFVNTDVMSAEFKGNLNVVGTNTAFGLLGAVEALRGNILFRETKFSLTSGNARFESPTKVAPRFNVSGRALVRESKVQAAEEYDVNLQVFGTPSDYRIRLTSSPALAENDIISLLLLGVTSKNKEGNYMDLGTTIVGQLPFQSKLESQLGVDIRLNTQPTKQGTTANTPATASGTTVNTDSTVPSVKIQKDITKRTKVSYSNTLEAVPYREFKIEHFLDDNFSVNGTAVGGRTREGTETNTLQSYGLDFRYRFQFE